MSLYTAFEIAAWIIAAAVVGCVIGWLLSLARRDQRLALELDAADARARTAATTLATREREIIQLTEQSQRVAIEGRETAGALRVQLAAAQDHRDQARSSLADARADIERLRAEGRALADQLERTTKQLSDARAAVDHLTGECTNAQRMLAAVEVERDQALDERDAKRAEAARLNTLQGERDRAVGKVEALKMRLDDAVERRTRAEDALIGARAETDRLQARLAGELGLEGEEAALLAVRTAERDGLADQVTRLEALYADADQARQDAQGLAASLRQALEVERVDHAATEATLSAVQQERNHLRAVLALQIEPFDGPDAAEPPPEVRHAPAASAPPMVEVPPRVVMPRAAVDDSIDEPLPGEITVERAPSERLRAASRPASAVPLGLSADVEVGPITALIEPEEIEIEVVEPEADAPEATEPEATEPEAAAPEAAEPEAAEPEAAEPEAAEPEAAEPEAAEPEPAAAEPEARSAPEPHRPPDDLTRIKGIGRKTARKLLGRGVTRFDQLAALDDAGMTALAKGIGMSPERLLREDWPGQARGFLDEG